MPLALLTLSAPGCRQSSEQAGRKAATGPIDSSIRQALEEDTPYLVVAVANLNCGGCDEILRCLIVHNRAFASARYFVGKANYKKFVSMMPALPEGHVLAFPGDLASAPYRVQNVAILRWQQGRLLSLPMGTQWETIIPADSLDTCISTR